MNQAKASTGWSRLQRALHWWTAALIVLVIAVGWWMMRVADSDLLLKFLLFQLHKTVGIAILACVAARLWLRLSGFRPPFPSEMPRWQQQAAGAVHGLLYALLVIVPVLGYLAADTAAVRVPTLLLGIIPLPAVTGANPYWFAILAALHWQLTVALILLAGGHTLAALHDHVQGHTTLPAMWRGPPHRSEQ
jgi:cytochrome b561